jgi:HAMP domain-containing protein
VKLPVKLAARLIEAFGTATFRTSALVSVAFAATTLALFAFIFWQTAGYERSRVDQFLRHEVAALVREPAGDVVGDVDSRYAGDLHRQSFAAVFTPGLGVLGGTLAAFPRGLPVDGRVYLAKVLRQTAHGTATEVARLVARTLPDRRVVVVGRSDADLAKLRQVVWRALELGLAPGVALALLAGTFASLRMLARAGAMNAAIERIMTGALDERLPTQRGRDGLDRLAASVNRMLDEIGRLLTELQGVGDDIAHELRTPLSRARSRLEGGRERGNPRGAGRGGRSGDRRPGPDLCHHHRTATHPPDRVGAASGPFQPGQPGGDRARGGGSVPANGRAAGADAGGGRAGGFHGVRRSRPAVRGRRQSSGQCGKVRPSGWPGAVVAGRRRARGDR